MTRSMGRHSGPSHWLKVGSFCNEMTQHVNRHYARGVEWLSGTTTFRSRKEHAKSKESRAFPHYQLELEGLVWLGKPEKREGMCASKHSCQRVKSAKKVRLFVQLRKGATATNSKEERAYSTHHHDSLLPFQHDFLPVVLELGEQSFPEWFPLLPLPRDDHFHWSSVVAHLPLLLLL